MERNFSAFSSTGLCGPSARKVSRSHWRLPSAAPVPGTIAGTERAQGHIVLDAQSYERCRSRFSTYFQHAIMMLI